MVLRFIPQAVLNGWVDQGQVDIQADKLVELASRQEFPVREAVHFVKVEQGVDTQGWTNKVLSLEEIRAGGAEHSMRSVILGDTVYLVDPGWLAQDVDGAAPSPAAGRSGPKKGEGKNPEADALAQLLLDKLS
jgi:hypothetical protein